MCCMLLELISDNKRQDMAFMHLIANHLCLLRNDVTKAEWHLQAASKYPMMLN